MNIPAIFFDHDHYEERLRFGDALVSSIDWLATSAAIVSYPETVSPHVVSCCLSDYELDMQDFMSILTYILNKALNGKHPRLDIRDFVDACDKSSVTVANFSYTIEIEFASEFIYTILWCCHLYCAELAKQLHDDHYDKVAFEFKLQMIGLESSKDVAFAKKELFDVIYGDMTKTDFSAAVMSALREEEAAYSLPDETPHIVPDEVVPAESRIVPSRLCFDLMMQILGVKVEDLTYGKKQKFARLLELLTGYSANTCRHFNSDQTYSREENKDIINELNQLFTDLALPFEVDKDQ